MENIYPRLSKASYDYVSAQGYIQGEMKRGLVSVEDFIRKTSISYYEKLKFKTYDLNEQMSGDVVKIIGEWRTIPGQDGIPEEEINKEIYEKMGKRNFYSVAFIYRRKVNDKFEFYLNFFLYNWKWRKLLGSYRIERKEKKVYFTEINSTTNPRYAKF